MQTIISLHRRLKALKVKPLIKASFEETKSDLIEENKDQLFSGFNKSGGRLQEYRSILYAEVKNRMNPLPGEGNPDLKVTGAFYKGIKASIAGGTIKIISVDSKGAGLEKKYGSDIFGLGGSYKAKYIQKSLGPAVRKKITDATGLSFK